MTTRYLDKACASCHASFEPTSGRQRYCDECRDPKWITARNTESKQRQRAEDTIEDLTRPPRQVKVFGDHRLGDRVEWIHRGLALARQFHSVGRIGYSQEIMKWVNRTALGEVGLIGPHHLDNLLDCVQYPGPLIEFREVIVSPFASPVRIPTESKRGQDRDYVSPGQSVMASDEMSESGAAEDGG